jgi:hypothetical protein
MNARFLLKKSWLQIQETAVTGAYRNMSGEQPNDAREGADGLIEINHWEYRI